MVSEIKLYSDGYINFARGDGNRYAAFREEDQAIGDVNAVGTGAILTIDPANDQMISKFNIFNIEDTAGYRMAQFDATIRQITLVDNELMFNGN